MKNGIREGQGTFYYIDGRVYRGAWHNDMKTGYGV